MFIASSLLIEFIYVAISWHYATLFTIMRRLAQAGLRTQHMQVFGPYVGCHLAWRPAATSRVCLRSGTAISGGALDMFFCLVFFFFF